MNRSTGMLQMGASATRVVMVSMVISFYCEWLLVRDITHEHLEQIAQVLIYSESDVFRCEIVWIVSRAGLYSSLDYVL